MVAPAEKPVATAIPPVEGPEVAPVLKQSPPDVPFVVIRKPVTEHGSQEPDQPLADLVAASTVAPPLPEARPAKPKRRSAAPDRKPDVARSAEREKAGRKLVARKEAEKRERRHRRHSKRVGRRALSVDLKEGERVTLSLEGWSRFRRATLVVTNYRVALITRMPPQVRWIPLEEVAGIHLRWQGANSVVVTSPIEILTLQKAKRQMLASFEHFLRAEVRDARSIGSDRHHADITQEYLDRATEMWDSMVGRFRLWMRRHPTIAVGAGSLMVVTAYLLATVFSHG